MKRIKRLIAMLVLVSILAVTMTSCYGNFALTRKVYQINGQISSEKWVRTIVFWALTWIPVYSFSTFIDAAILNAIEFWTGTNPLAMNSTDQETQFYAENGQDIKVVTSQNRYDIYDLNNEDNSFSFVFSPENQAWMLEKDGKLMTIADEHNGMTRFFDLDGNLASVEKL